MACTDEKEKEMCNILNNFQQITPNEPGNVKKTYRKYIFKNHPDKIKEDDPQPPLPIGEIVEIFNECSKRAESAGNVICGDHLKGVYTEKTHKTEFEEPPNMKTAKCIRNIVNWPKSKKYHKFDTSYFDADLMKEDINKYSPKLQALLDNIQELDAQDKQKYNKVYKHFIFSDLKSSAHGAKLIASALKAIGMNSSIIQKNNRIEFEIPSNSEYNNFGILCSSTLFSKPYPVRVKKDMLAGFNKRPDNVYGKDVRIIILDAGFKEGVDLFDIKYVHLFEPARNSADRTQAVGRATRFCGQKGLNFIPNVGWKLDVFTYLANKNDISMEELYHIYAGTNLNQVALREQLEKLSIESAVDKDLNTHIHSGIYKKDQETSLYNRLDSYDNLKAENNRLLKGGANPDLKTIFCTDKIVGKRTTKNFPYTLQYLKEKYDILSINHNIPIIPRKIKSSLEKRKYYCEFAKKNYNYAYLLEKDIKKPIYDDTTYYKKYSQKECGKRSNSTLPFRTSELENAFIKAEGVFTKGYDKMSQVNKRQFLCKQLSNNKKFADILETLKPINIPEERREEELKDEKQDERKQDNQKQDERKQDDKKQDDKKQDEQKQDDQKQDEQKQDKNNQDKQKQQEQKQEETEYTQTNNTPKDDIDYGLAEDEPFDAFQKRINSAFKKYKYDPITIKNMCNLPQSSSRIVEFTPSQDFISHYFVPQNRAKGLLIWHSVGTGKTCTAVATKSKTWDKQNYTVLWVTRTTLRADIWKNMFDKVCDYTIKEKLAKGIKIPTGNEGKKFLTKNFLPPISFAQLSNLCKIILGKKKIPNQPSALYNRLVRRNGKTDPLHKTLIIVDEAHKILAKDLVGPEKPDYNSIHEAFLRSYEKSEKDSCRPLLMTATPIMEDPMDYIKLLNLIQPKQMPPNVDEFLKEYPIDDQLKFSKEAINKFQSLMKGKISYLNRSYDPRNFAQPTFQVVEAQISTNVVSEQDYEDLENEHNEEITKCNDEYQEDTLKEEVVKQEIDQTNKEHDGVQTQIDEIDKVMQQELADAYTHEKPYIREKYTLKKQPFVQQSIGLKQILRTRSAEYKKLVQEHFKTLKDCLNESDKKYSKQKKILDKKAKEDNDITQENMLKKKCLVDPKRL
tara:strand:- start:4233 stop:7619 length:3387 start_codon:yes stop_codon:yes gene_type:complete